MRYFRRTLSTFFFWVLAFTPLMTNVSAVEEQRKQITFPPSIPQVEKPPAAGLPRPVQQVPKVWGTSVAETQRELAEILRTHQVLQVQQQAQLKEIQRIRERAQAHQKILNELKPTTQATGGGAAVEEAIRAQKIALIQDETRKNRARLRRLQRKGVLSPEEAMEEEKKGILESFNTKKSPPAPQKPKEEK